VKQLFTGCAVAGTTTYSPNYTTNKNKQTTHIQVQTLRDGVKEDLQAVRSSANRPPRRPLVRSMEFSVHRLLIFLSRVSAFRSIFRATSRTRLYAVRATVDAKPAACARNQKRIVKKTSSTTKMDSNDHTINTTTRRYWAEPSLRNTCMPIAHFGSARVSISPVCT
jgi:hypothetical protein